MKENWFALLVSIVTNKNASQSLKYMGIAFPNEKTRLNLLDSDYEEIIELKKNNSWVDLEAKYNIDRQVLSVVVRNYKKKKAIIDGDLKAPSITSLNKNSVSL